MEHRELGNGVMSVETHSQGAESASCVAGPQGWSPGVHDVDAVKS